MVSGWDHVTKSQPNAILGGLTLEGMLITMTPALCDLRGDLRLEVPGTSSALINYHPKPPWLCLQVKWKSLSRVLLFATPWTIESTGLSRPEYWSG